MDGGDGAGARILPVPVPQRLRAMAAHRRTGRLGDLIAAARRVRTSLAVQTA
ncbi:hypothetical protein ISN34_09045 [Xanthomonas translucens pv. translucens]|uniref:hypothetical protein n=1 Tax=Xanthomonas campestris pv. translucens TaxID=343 RepID=UPI0002DA443B|nr:hypothetical protein [Xanthomonas translucens]QSQ46941.1 hypothetical protein ISN34_09045 [Xanthomonas translucens pv. translucens]